MDRIKIVFFDIDGTLVDMNTKHITPRTVDALRRLRARGIKVCIATGRSPMTLPDFGGAVFDAFLTFNGSLCYAGDEVIFSNPIPHADVLRLIANAAALGRPVAVATGTTIAANGADQDLTDYFAIANEQPHLADDFDAVCAQEVYQLMLGCRAPDYPALLRGADGAKVAAWWDRAADIIPASGGKGIGIEKMLAYYGFTRDEAMAFGDGSNDIEMLCAVGHGIAMENATPDLKAVADDVCGNVSEDGVARYCEGKGLI